MNEEFNKNYAVEKRPCGGCEHHRQLFDGGICRKHLMGMPASAFVNYKRTEGTCYSSKKSLIDSPTEEKRTI